MKLFRLTGLLGTAAIALLVTTTSCKKSSNSAPKVGTLTFTLNGKSVNMLATADTSGEVVITAVGPLPGTTDTAQLTLYTEIYDLAGGQAWAQSYTGNFPDSSVVHGSAATLTDLTAGYTMYDNYTPAVGKIFDVNITSNNGSVASGTFSGWVYLTSGTGPDSTSITNGKFSVQL